MAVLPRPVMMMIWSQPAASASSTPYWMMGLSTSGSISFGIALVAGRKRVPSPAAGKTALRTFIFIVWSSLLRGAAAATVFYTAIQHSLLYRLMLSRELLQQLRDLRDHGFRR